MNSNVCVCVLLTGNIILASSYKGGRGGRVKLAAERSSISVYNPACASVCHCSLLLLLLAKASRRDTHTHTYNSNMYLNFVCSTVPRLFVP